MRMFRYAVRQEFKVTGFIMLGDQQIPDILIGTQNPEFRHHCIKVRILLYRPCHMKPAVRDPIVSSVHSVDTGSA